MISKMNKIFNYMVLLFFLVIISGILFYKFDSSSQRSFFGYRFYTVLSNSMKKIKPEQQGNFVAGDMVIVKVTPPEDIMVGDIMTFYPKTKEENYVTHRVIKVIPPKTTGESSHFMTQGDANNLADAEISGEQVVGKVVFNIPKLGLVTTFVQINIVKMMIFVLFVWVAIVLLRYSVSK